MKPLEGVWEWPLDEALAPREKKKTTYVRYIEFNCAAVSVAFHTIVKPGQKISMASRAHLLVCLKLP